MQALPKPPRHRDRTVVNIPVLRGTVGLAFPRDMTEAEAEKIANIIRAYAKNVTTWNVEPLS